jgi:hypothetical protein
MCASRRTQVNAGEYCDRRAESVNAPFLEGRVNGRRLDRGPQTREDRGGHPEAEPRPENNGGPKRGTARPGKA